MSKTSTLTKGKRGIIKRMLDLSRSRYWSRGRVYGNITRVCQGERMRATVVCLTNGWFINSGWIKVRKRKDLRYRLFRLGGEKIRRGPQQAWRNRRRWEMTSDALGRWSCREKRRQHMGAHAVVNGNGTLGPDRSAAFGYAMNGSQTVMGQSTETHWWTVTHSEKNSKKEKKRWAGMKYNPRNLEPLDRKSVV